MHQISPKSLINAFATEGGYPLSKVLVLILFGLSLLTTSFSQEVTVKVPTNTNEIKKILAKEGEAEKLEMRLAQVEKEFAKYLD